MPDRGKSVTPQRESCGIRGPSRWMGVLRSPAPGHCILPRLGRHRRTRRDAAAEGRRVRCHERPSGCAHPIHRVLRLTDRTTRQRDPERCGVACRVRDRTEVRDRPLLLPMEQHVPELRPDLDREPGTDPVRQLEGGRALGRHRQRQPGRHDHRSRRRDQGLRLPDVPHLSPRTGGRPRDVRDSPGLRRGVPSHRDGVPRSRRHQRGVRLDDDGLVV